MAMTIAPDDTLDAQIAVGLVPAVELVKGMGWLPDWPDHRDYTAEHPEVQPHLESLGSRRSGHRGVAPRSN